MEGISEGLSGDWTEDVSVRWTGEGFGFVGHLREHETTIDGDGVHGPNPVSLLLEAIAACMAIDVVDILVKGRQEVRDLAVRTLARRMETPPRYVTSLRFEYEVVGEVQEAKAERAVALSLERYCSVFHSLRKDIEVETHIRIMS